MGSNNGANSAKFQNSTTVQPSSSSSGMEGSTGDGTSVFRKMTKSFGSAKEALSKLAKNNEKD